MTGKRAWDQLEDEPPKAYTLFLLYRSLGVTRSVKEVAKRIQRSSRKVQVIANKFNWVFRADQWDAWALAHKSRAQERRLLREAEVESRTVADTLKTARILARRTLRNVRRQKDFTLTPHGAAQIADLAVKLARLERGEVTSRSGTEVKRARDELNEKLAGLREALKPSDAQKEKKT